MVLESYARKWLDDPNFKEQAQEVIKSHNDEYNASGEFVLSSERTPWGDVFFQRFPNQSELMIHQPGLTLDLFEKIQI